MLQSAAESLDENEGEEYEANYRVVAVQLLEVKNVSK